MSEIWKEIEQYNNYSVSTTGMIKNNTTQRVLKYYIRNGYPSITLSKDNSKKTFNIHTIVASHFLIKPDGIYVVNHKNENKEDSRLENLEYITYGENTKYSATNKRSKNCNDFNLNDFKDIPCYSGYMASKDGSVYSKKLKRLCCITILPNGYHKIKLKHNNGHYKDLYVHVIIAITYMDYTPSTNMIVINHIDGKKSNNHLSNLEIITQKENVQHSVILNKHTLFRRSVYYVDDNGNKHEFNSAKDACISTGIDNSSILKSCKSDFRLAGGYRWYFCN